MPNQNESSLSALAGALLFYLAIVILASAVGLLGLVLFPQRTHRHLQSLQAQLSRVVIQGLALTVGVVVLVVALGSLTEVLRSAKVAGADGVGLVVALIGLSFIGLGLMGYGAVAWHLGERVARIFGWYELPSGYSVLLGSALIWAVVWLPLFGWALGVYWLALAVGGLFVRGQPSEANSP